MKPPSDWTMLTGLRTRRSPGVRWPGYGMCSSHQYEGVDLERVWAIVEAELSHLREAIAQLLPPLEQLERELAGENESSEDV